MLVVESLKNIYIRLANELAAVISTDIITSVRIVDAFLDVIPSIPHNEIPALIKLNQPDLNIALNDLAAAYCFANPEQKATIHQVWSKITALPSKTLALLNFYNSPLDRAIKESSKIIAAVINAA